MSMHILEPDVIQMIKNVFQTDYDLGHGFEIEMLLDVTGITSMESLYEYIERQEKYILQKKESEEEKAEVIAYSDIPEVDPQEEICEVVAPNEELKPTEHDIPLFLPLGRVYPDNQILGKEPMNGSMGTHDFYNANYHRVYQMCGNTNIALVVATIRTYVYRLGVSLHSEFPVSSAYHCNKKVYINMHNVEDHISKETSEKLAKALLGDYMDWLHLYSLLFQNTQPVWHDSLYPDAQRLINIIFSDKTMRLSRNKWPCILHGALSCFASDDIMKLSLATLRKHKMNDKLKNEFIRGLAKELDEKYIPGAYLADPKVGPEKNHEELLYNDGVVSLILKYNKINEDDNVFAEIESLGNLDFPISLLERERRRARSKIGRIAQYRNPRMKLFYNSAHMGDYNYEKSQFERNRDFPMISAHLLKQQQSNIFFYDPMYTSNRDSSEN